MSSNVGLTTPRGSGTSGYVQTNKAHLRPRDNPKPYPSDFDSLKHRQRQPDAEILEHDRKRQIEVKIFELRDKLEDEGVDEDEIDDQCAALRKKLEREGEKGGGKDARGLKSHQVHQLAEAKIEESERLRRALGIGRDYEEGSHWRKQDERKLEAERERGKICVRIVTPYTASRPYYLPESTRLGA
ncbi:RNA-splicing factor [Saxophila tyrrhenica]|uniref:RNA-splicing factor n=1 Tax=Saxophila tyrrhenica TaxID=1690608 RepID=A0AAV9NXX0_9PEZI|nr:RNA-splicing factor [Saxophila tyrrhenica]